MTQVLSKTGLLDLALAANPRATVAATLTFFLERTQEILGCRRSVLVADGGSDDNSPTPALISLPAGFALSDSESALLKHCQTVLTRLNSGSVVSLDDGCGPGASARLFAVPDVGFMLLFDAAAVWDACLTDAYLRILDSLSHSIRSIRKSADARQNRIKLDLVSRAAHVGFFEWNSVTDSITWSAGMVGIFGLRDGSLSGTAQDFIRRIGPDSVGPIQKQLAAFMESDSGDSAQFSYTIVADTGELKRVESHALFEKNAMGQGILSGVIYDISDVESSYAQSLYRSDFERLLIDVSTRLVNCYDGSIDQVIETVLRDVGLFVVADRAYIFDYDNAAGTCSNSYEWCNAGIEPQIDDLKDIPVGEFRYFYAAHKQGQPFVLRGVSSLKASNPLRQILEPQGIQSLATFPLMDGDECKGFIGFDAVLQERHWSNVDVSVLMLLAGLVANARERSLVGLQIRENERELRQSRDRAKAMAREAMAANTSKTDFISRVSHELRAPLHAINGLTGILVEGVEESERLTHLNTIHEAGRTMLELINDVLDHERLESEGIELRLADTNLYALLDQQASLAKSVLAEKSIAFSLEIDSAVPQWVICDALRVGQILQNLLSNAIKFTTQGCVSLKVSVIDTGHDGDSVTLCLSVTDTGIGISPECFEDLFRPFVQVNQGKSSGEGTGLGLSIVKKLVDKMAGAISIDSKPGRGSCFSVTLSCLQGSPPEHLVGDGVSRPLEESYDGDTLRVLMAEDNRVNAQLVKLYLRNTNTHLDLAENGREACELYRANEYDLILMDCEMPVMNGFEATRRIKKFSQEQGSVVRIIAVTAAALGADIDRCKAAGMDGVLTKPFDRSSLLKIIAQHRGFR